MNIDFGKPQRSTQRATRGRGNYSLKKNSGRSASKKVTLLLSSLVLTFTIGLISGMSIGDFRTLNQNFEAEEYITPNISDNENLSDTVQVDQEPPAQTSNQINGTGEKPNNQIEQNQEVAQASEQKDNDVSHLILAGVFDDSNSAHKAGIDLQQEGLPVFLAASGSKMKLYVGPIEGEKKARNLLAQIKNQPEFRGAILYRK